MRNDHKISLVIPCYNEEGGIAKVIPTVPEFIDEIIVVDNNSSDRTAEVAQSLGARVVSETRQGYGCAYKAGLPSAEGDIIVTMDGDGTYPAHAISYLLDTLFIDGLDFVSAARIPVQWAHCPEHDQTLFREHCSEHDDGSLVRNPIERQPERNVGFSQIHPGQNSGDQ